MTEITALPLSETLPIAVAAIHKAQSIVMACHVNPDGDALGSLLGLAHGLAPLGKTLTLLSEDGVPEILRFLPGTECISRSSDIAVFDLAIVLDSGDFARVGETVQPIILRAKTVIDVDHHATSGAFGDIQVLDARAASTSEIVYALLLELNLPITPDAAMCLFTGVITDTGSFRFQNVTPNTLRVAATLLEDGAAPAVIADHVFENRTYAATRLLGDALTTLSTTPDGRLVWAHITNADFLRLGATDEDTEGVVNYVRGVRGAEVGILFREMANGKIRISLRSRETVNVAEVAAQFGGGGHRMAAGCSLTLPLADAQRAVLEAVQAVLP